MLKRNSIHTFNKSGRHLEFSMNDVICGKIIHVAKMATKDESSVDVDFAVGSYKKECFSFISRGIFSTYHVFMSIISYLESFRAKIFLGVANGSSKTLGLAKF